MKSFRNILAAFLLLPLLLTAGVDLNQLFGIKLFPAKPELLWQESNAEIFGRLLNSRVSGVSSNTLAVFPLRQKTVLGIPAVELRIVRTPQGGIERIDIYFYNKGDSAKERSMKMKIRRSGQSIVEQLTQTFGQGTKTAFGSASKRKEAVKWETPQVIFVAEAVKGEFCVLHLLPPENEKTAEKNDQNSALPKVDLVSNVQNNEFGDYWIANIPMVNQGNKGYCAPATVERVLLYYGCTDLDMHRIADIAQTGRGGGTSISTLNNTLSPILRKKRITPFKTGEIVFFNIQKYVSRGIPVLWCMYTNPIYERVRTQNTIERRKCSSPRKWKNMVKKHPKIPAGGSPHVCLIIGFNEQTKEIAVSNSWGESELLPSWISLLDAKKISMHQSWVYLPDFAKEKEK